MPTFRALLAEFVGTFALVFVGAAAIVGGGSLLVVALAHGLILAVMISATPHLSGGLFNPAVSIGLAAIGKQSWAQAGVFIATQLVAGIAAAVLVKGVFAGDVAAEVTRLGATLGRFSAAESADASGVWHVNPTSVAKTLGLEIIATFFLMFVIMGTVVDPRGDGKNAAVGGFAVGLVVTADMLAFGPLTGASMNPARSFGPALIASAWDMHWVYWVAPIAGAALAALTWHHVFGSDADG